jgi:hypothetical protein
MLTAACEQGIKIEDTEDSANQDSEMVDVSGMPSEDEEGENGEGEDDEEGEDEPADEEAGETPNVEEANRDAPEQQSEDAEMAEVVQPSSVEEPDEPRPAPEEEEVLTIPKLRFQPPSLGNLGASHHGPSKIEGSPLKNVMIQSPTEPSPLISSQAASASFSTSSYPDVQSRTVSIDQGLSSTASQAYAAETTKHGILPPLRDNGSSSRMPSHDKPAAAATAKLPAEIPPPTPAQPAEVSTTTSDQHQAPSDPQPDAATASSEPTNPVTEETCGPAAQPEESQEAQPAPAPETSSSSSILQPPDSPALLPTVAADDEDDGLNLLGSLERELDRQASASSGGGGSDGKNTPVAAAATAAAVTEAPTAVPVEAGGGEAASGEEAQAALEDAAAAAAEATVKAEAADEPAGVSS